MLSKPVNRKPSEENVLGLVNWNNKFLYQKALRIESQDEYVPFLNKLIYDYLVLMTPVERREEHTFHTPLLEFENWFLQRGYSIEHTPNLFDIGCVGKIITFKETDDKRYLIELKGLIRFEIINEVVDPLISSSEELLVSVDPKTNKSRFEDIVSLKEELHGFRDTLRGLAESWSFYPEDGAVISLSPLRELFKHPQWVSRLKKASKELASGKYDWSKLSFHYHPERVLKTSHVDRSIAIAQGVEDDLWEEVEIPSARGKKLRVVCRPREISEAELEIYIKRKIAQG